ncbi:hypothetical protein PMH09_20215 [Roseofilum sp. BLCC_M143]|uniref:Uncharacterized protein n=1 Tax=Roseofilum casamattae BLCC-M143 TaxID=3022442 RepID=A0ABT7C255_9CYAN|nr:hypothetical protein [Roseofilum casamattae BLCC-M143]
MQNLSEGNYKYYTGELRGEIFKLSYEYNDNHLELLKKTYRSCLRDEIDWTGQDIQYLALRDYISHLSEKKDIIVDVTSASKSYLSDILACSLLESIEGLYAFELIGKPPNYDKPWTTLIHELDKTIIPELHEDAKEQTSYEYINLIETPIFKEGRKSILIRTTPLFISIIGTLLFVLITLAATFILGFSSIFVQIVSLLGAVLGITSFFLIYFPLRVK